MKRAGGLNLVTLLLTGVASGLLAEHALSSESCPNCLLPKVQGPLTPALERILPVEGSACDGVFQSEAEEEYHRLYPSSRPTRQANIAGITLRGTAEELKYASRIVGEKSSASERGRPPSAWPSVAAGCGTVVCALTRLWGSEEAAYRTLNIAARTGYAVSASQQLNPQGADQLWSLSEIRKIDEVLKDTPAQFYHLPTLKVFVRQHNNYVQAGMETAAAWADPNPSKPLIAVRNSLFSNHEFEKFLLYHELMHHYDFQGGEGKPKRTAERIGYYGQSGWHDKRLVENPDGTVGEEWSRNTNACFDRDYPRDSRDPQEDFADTAASYRYRAAILRQKCPEKYRFMKDRVFQGEEFLEAEPWPAVDQLVAALPGKGSENAKLLGRCLGTFQRVDVDSARGAGYLLRFPTDSLTSVSRPGNSDDAVRACAKELLPEIQSALRNDPRFCREGEAGVRAALETRIGRVLPGFLDTVWEAQQRAPRASVTGCIADRNFTPTCAIYDVLQKAKGNFGLTQADLRSLGARIDRIFPPTSEVKQALRRSVSTQEAVLACLSSLPLKKIGQDWDVARDADFRHSIERDYNRSPQKLAACESGVIEHLRTRGITASSASISALLDDDPRLSVVAKNFQSNLLFRWSHPGALCMAKDSRTCAERVIESWARDVNLDAAESKRVLVPLLLKYRH